MGVSDDRLVSAALAGDPTAFATLVEVSTSCSWSNTSHWTRFHYGSQSIGSPAP